MQHPFGGGVGAGDRRQLDIGPVTLDRERLGGVGDGVLGEAAVFFGAPRDATQLGVAVGVLHGGDDHSFAEACRVDVRANGHDAAAGVGSLDPGEIDVAVPAARCGLDVGRSCGVG